jgi:hypothetical protein
MSVRSQKTSSLNKKSGLRGSAFYGLFLYSIAHEITSPLASVSFNGKPKETVFRTVSAGRAVAFGLPLNEDTIS